MKLPTPPVFPAPGTFQAKIVNRFGDANVVLYRLTGGRIGGRFAGAPVLLLNHVGRKSGQRRTAALLYLEDGQDVVIVGSRGGSDAPPAWWLNLQANPRTSVEIGREKRDVVARQATPEEKARLWPRLVAMYHDYDTYQGRTSREIPVIILSPASAQPPVG